MRTSWENVCMDLLRLKRLVAGNQSGKNKTLRTGRGTRQDDGHTTGAGEVALKGQEHKGDC